MPIINFSTPVMGKSSEVVDDNIIQIDVKEGYENRKSKIQSDEVLKSRERYIEIRENELAEKEMLLNKKEEKLKLIIRAMMAKEEEIKRKEAYIIKMIPKS